MAARRRPPRHCRCLARDGSAQCGSSDLHPHADHAHLQSVQLRYWTAPRGAGDGPRKLACTLANCFSATGFVPAFVFIEREPGSSRHCSTNRVRSRGRAASAAPKSALTSGMTVDLTNCCGPNIETCSCDISQPRRGSFGSAVLAGSQLRLAPVCQPFWLGSQLLALQFPIGDQAKCAHLLCVLQPYRRRSGGWLAERPVLRCRRDTERSET